MIKVGGLPADITKSDLDELFKNYGKIKSFKIKRERDKIFVYVELDTKEGEKRAIEELDREEWRGDTLYLDPVRGENDEECQPESEGCEEDG